MLLLEEEELLLEEVEDEVDTEEVEVTTVEALEVLTEVDLEVLTEEDSTSGPMETVRSLLATGLERRSEMSNRKKALYS